MSMFDVYLGEGEIVQTCSNHIILQYLQCTLPEIKASSVLALSRKGIRKSESHTFVRLVNILCLNIANTYVHKLQLKTTGYLQ